MSTHTDILPVEKIIKAGSKHNVYELSCGVFAVVDINGNRIEECCNTELDAIEVAEKLDDNAKWEG